MPHAIEALVATGRVVFDQPNAERLRRELLGLPPGEPVHERIRGVLVAICDAAPAVTVRVSSLHRVGGHHAEGRAVDIGNEEIASTILPLIATAATVARLSIDEIIFDASRFGEANGNRYNFDQGRPHEFNATVLNQHRDHIHISVLP